MSLTISPFTSGDIPGTVELLAATMAADPISESRFTHQVLLDPNFRTAGMPVAREGDKVAGLCLSLARQVPLENGPSDADRGYITLIAVRQDLRHRGIGGKLLAAAEEYLRAENRTLVMVSPYAPGYFIPGVDVDAYAPALGFFKKHGYAEVYRPLAMQTDLWNWSTPQWVQDKRVALAREGLEIKCYEPALTLPLLEFAQKEFPGDWVRVIRETMARILARDAGGATRLMAAIERREVVAFSHFENERFGPIGVAASQRGRCVGQVLMYATLEAQRAAGFRCAWFLWSDDKTAERIYSGARFKEVRRFAVMKKELS